MARTVAAVLSALALALQSASDPIPTAFDRLPRLVLWAWERPTDLRGLGGDTAVAFLAQTVVVAAGRVDVVPRRQPLRVDADTPLIAVTRVEVPGRDPAALTPEALDRVARAIAATAGTPRIAAVQIDFDATGSQRRAYRDLLHRVRAALDSSVLLSMTALASWCAGDAWLDGLPVDEAVPMLFRMGPSAPRLQNGVDRVIRAPECHGAIGAALDEPVAIPAGARRTYVFNPHPWSDSSIAAARRLAPARSRS
jgi:hypothetical protein